MNAGDIPPAAYQVLHMLSYPRGVSTLAGGVGGGNLGHPLSHPDLAGGGGAYLGQGVGTLGYPPVLTWPGVPTLAEGYLGVPPSWPGWGGYLPWTRG